MERRQRDASREAREQAGEVLGAFRTAIAGDWAESDYYDGAEEVTDWFWTDELPFHRLFQQLDLAHAIELACGRGRHAARCIDQCGTLTLADVNASNIEACRRRFAGSDKVRFMVTPGNALPECGDGEYSALYCYDAMVHFEMLDVLDYMREFRRILRPGGRALLHLSNSRGNPTGFYHENVHWRNFGDLDVFRHFAHRLDFSLLESQAMDWGGAPGIDGVMLLERN